MFFANPFKSRLPDMAEALPGRETAIMQPRPHAVSGRDLAPPFPDGLKEIVLGMGCFWGAERLFWQMEGVFVTAVGYAGGLTPNPTYQEVCSGRTGHSEVVRVIYDPKTVSLMDVLAVFWQEHDPTQGNRQGNDTGTQYRSVIYSSHEDDQAIIADSAKHYGLALAQAGRGSITTEIRHDVTFYYAEDEHQQYLHKVPNGYCGLQGCGVSFDKEQMGNS